jgi:hypothetical protein
MARDGGLRQLFPEHLRDAHWQAVETHSTGWGVPDSEYCFPGGLCGWVEYKLATTPRDVLISPGQVAWAERRARMGGRVSLAVRYKSARNTRRAAFDRLVLYGPEAVRHVRERGLAVEPWAQWDGGPAAWDWDKVRLFLTR